MTCSRCGTAVDADEADDGTPIAPAGWSWAPSVRGVEWLCLACTRENVRAIEAKLPEEWW